MEKGLTAQAAQEKLRIFGKNEITTDKKFSAFSLLLGQFTTVLHAILAAAAIFSFLIHDVLDAIFIFTVILLNGILGFIQEYKAEKSLEKLKHYLSSLVRVIRDGHETQVQAVFLVPSDIVLLSEGDRIPADGSLNTHAQLEVDESILTGESLPIVKNQHDILYSGTLVTQGSGHLHIEKTGMQTRFGHIAQTLSDVSADETPLQRRLDSLAKTLSVIIIAVAALLIPLGLWQGKEIVPLMLLAVSIAVAAIPQGLPAVVTIALALGVSRMAKKRAIVRQMQAIETLGAVQVILSDKTGTLTQNAMRVKKHWVSHHALLPLLYKACLIGNTASLIHKAETHAYDIVGDKTDGALLLYAHSQVPESTKLTKDGKVVEEYTFDPDRKTVTTIWEEKDKRTCFVRGAPEMVLAKSKQDTDEKKHITKLFEEYAKEGFRVIGFGYKPISTDKTIKRDEAESDLSFLGFLGIYDPPREEAKRAVREAHMAGIHTVMVTGDNELTALAIAKEVGLIDKNEDVVTGKDLEKMPDSELDDVIKRTRIFARTKPEDKLRLVSLFKKQGYIVGVTGDGVNDALALKRADVGVAMGQKGTDVAKEASDIVLTDDNFSTLVRAVEEGRIIYSNILKAITYLLSGNLSEISLVFFAALLGLPNPLLPTQILWINLVTDGLPALALASDTKDGKILQNKPRNPNMPILTKQRITFITVTGLLLAAFLLFLFHYLLQSHSETFARTVVFNTLIASHMLIAFLVRGESMFRMNKFLLISVACTLLLQLIITTIPFFQTIFHLSLK